MDELFGSAVDSPITGADEVPYPADPDRSGRSEADETVTIERLRAQWYERGPVAAGALIDALLSNRRNYVDEEISRSTLAGGRVARLGPVRTADEHLAVVRARWDKRRAPAMTGRHAIVGLALDAEVGGQLLRDGVIGSLLRGEASPQTSLWPGSRVASERPPPIAWDVLSDAGRELAERQPLLAAAMGAPAEATVTLPAAASAIAWSPAGDRLAVLAGGTVYEVGLATGIPHPIGELGGSVPSIGWGPRGVVGLSIDGDRAELLRVRDRTSLGGWDGVTTGVLSGDGSHAWLRLADGVYRWAPAAAPVRLTSPGYTEPATPITVDWSGTRGLLRLRQNTVLVVAAAPGSLPAPSVGRDPYWPSDAAPMLGWGPPRSARCALLALGDRHAAAYAAPDGVDVWQLRPLAAATPDTMDTVGQSQLAVCRLATGPGEAGALAVDPTGTRLAVAIGERVAVWSLAERRPPAAPVPAYDTDHPDRAEDLLGADRDAQAIAALIAARDIHPPLSIGLFGAWGSGKSFILRQIIRLLRASDRPEGYLRHIRVVEFNAWQYAETNLWASLVDRVLQVIAPVKPPESPPEVTEAAVRAAEAANAARTATGEVTKAERELAEARGRLEKQRRRAAWLGAAVLVLAAAAIVALLLGDAGRLVAAATAALALLAAAAGLLDQARKAREQARDIADAGRSGIATVGRLLGRPAELAVQAKGAELRRRQEEAALASAAAKELTATRDQVTELAREQPLGALLHRLASVSDYRDQLSLVTRTRDHFDAVDRAISKARLEPVAAPPLERVVIVIDDLDRCPPEKVISVLEAVHLLFSFEMFVVLIAVDTRWLEQSLRIRYRQLLGSGAGSAVPTDYLEKIIQIPLHLRPLNESLARSMIAGLTRPPTAPGATSRPGSALLSDASSDRAGELASDGATEPRPGTAASGSDARELPGGGTPTPPASALTATVPRLAPKPLPAEVMQVSAAEAAAMSAVAALAGTTPRAVKRFVNTYRLLKARSADPTRFDAVEPAPDGNIGDHEVVAFLLAVVTGHPAAAGPLLHALATAAPGATVEQAVAAGGWEETGSGGGQAIQAWLAANPRYATSPADRLTTWSPEVARFSFTTPVHDTGKNSAHQ